MSLRAKIIFLVLVVLFVIFVWPTRYKYLTDWNTPARVDRITGKIEWAGQDGWTTQNPLFVEDDKDQATDSDQASPKQQQHQQDDDDSACEATAPFDSASKL